MSWLSIDDNVKRNLAFDLTTPRAFHEEKFTVDISCARWIGHKVIFVQIRCRL